MAPDPTPAPDDEPTQVSLPAADAASGPDARTPSDGPTSPPEDVVRDAPLWPDPASGTATPPPSAHAAAPGAATAAGARGGTADGTAAGGDGEPPAAGKGRGRSAADGARVAADRVTQAASATAQALRDTDVGEIARNTTKLIENTRPFFLAAFAIVFTFLAAAEDHAAIGVVFALGALLCVLGAAFSPAVDRGLGRRDDR